MGLLQKGIYLMIAKPVLLVVVDTEEEFDWFQPLARSSVTVKAMQQVFLGQEMCDAFDIRPTYVVDYPVAAQIEGFGPLKAFVDSGRAQIGAHLHPWVSPPHSEAVTAKNSFPGNLPAELEEAKLNHLTRQIQESFGLRPVIYKAGRYGSGPNTPAILERLGYAVDLSPAPPFDFSSGGGPDFSKTANQPFPIGPNQSVLSIPTTGDYTGLLSGSRRMAHNLYRGISGRWGQRCKIPGIGSRLGLLSRVRLSPEGYTLAELKTLTTTLMQRGDRIFTFSYHSPSLSPGCTPYVRDEQQLQKFLERSRRYFQFFFNELHGETRTPMEIKQMIEQKNGKNAFVE